MLAIDESALQREIDKARDDAVLPDRNLAQQQRLVAHLLQRSRADRAGAARLVDLVDEQKMRDRQIVQPLQIGLQHLHLRGLRLAHDDGRVDAGQNVQRVLQKFDGAGAIEEGETLVHDISWWRN